MFGTVELTGTLGNKPFRGKKGHFSEEPETRSQGIARMSLSTDTVEGEDESMIYSAEGIPELKHNWKKTNLPDPSRFHQGGIFDLGTENTTTRKSHQLQ